MTRVLVTGATGFVGRHVVTALAARGYDVHALSRTSAAAVATDGVTWHCADLLAADGTAQLVDAIAPTQLVHLAWTAKPGRFWSDPDNVRWVEATLALLRAFIASGGREVLVTGSCAEYAWDDGHYAEYDTPREPATLYGACKHAAHTVAHALCREAGVRLAWARLFFMFGPGEHPDRLVASAVRHLVDGRPFECTHGRQQRDFMYVLDVADALAALLASEVAGPVNVASGQNMTIRDLLGSVAKRVGRADLLRFGARQAPASEPALLVADTTRLEHELGWRSQRTLEQSIDETIAWWRQAAQDSQETSP